jgi:hypothetical protein
MIEKWQDKIRECLSLKNKTQRGIQDQQQKNEQAKDLKTRPSPVTCG